MEIKNNLIEMLSNIIHDKMNQLKQSQDNIEKSNKIKEIEEMLNESEINKIDDNKLKETLKEITDMDTIESIISNIDMIKIVINGINNGLELSLDESQLALISGVQELISNYRNELDETNIEKRQKLEEFIANCEQLSTEISSGVIRDIKTLDQILNESDIPINDIIDIKFDILKNNNNNYNLNLNGKVKEEVDIRITLKNIDIDLDTFSDIEKNILVNYSNIDNIIEITNYIKENNLNIKKNDILYILLFSNKDILSNIYNICNEYKLEFENMFKIPGTFISEENKEKISTMLNETKDNQEYYMISYLENIGAYYEKFITNITQLKNNNFNIKECFENNILIFVIPDIEKNITILSDMNLNNKDFSTIVINPYLATSRSSFNECGLKEYLTNNPIRLTTSYYRLKNIAANIVEARKNGGIIFRSLSDKKNYWLAKNITHNKRVI
ncbi:MAG: hypothetical protein J6D28_01350 [Bacilli bacterium]|nr:hypothetical protein [Bacilli bacterium]